MESFFLNRLPRLARDATDFRFKASRFQLAPKAAGSQPGTAVEVGTETKGMHKNFGENNDSASSENEVSLPLIGTITLHSCNHGPHTYDN